MKLKERVCNHISTHLVQVDSQGDEITKWNGGGVKEIISKVTVKMSFENFLAKCWSSVNIQLF
jgi:hypothetical protein